MSFLVVIPAGAAAVFWLIAFVSWWASVKYRREGIPLSSMLINGMMAFDSDNFTPEGQRHQRRFLKALAGFFVALFLSAAATIAVEAL